jgi:hypothetical protein
MTASSLIIVVDRGGLRAYRAEETPSRGVNLKLVQAFEIPNANRGANTNHTTALTDWPQLEIEENRRICRQLAEEIAKVVRQMPGEGWSLAAPKAISASIVKLLPNSIRERIVEHLESDLLKTPAEQLREHFRSLQPF